MSQAQPQKTSASPVGTIFRKVVVGAGFTVVVIVLLMWLAGVFAPKVDTAGPREPELAGRLAEDDTAYTDVELRRIPLIESAVGTIRAVHETGVASKLLAKVNRVHVQAGQSVQQGDVLVELDDRDLQAQLKQAEAGVTAAQAALDLAQTTYDRVKPLFDRGIEAKTEMDAADAALKTSKAELERAQQAREHARTFLDYATVRAPFDGRVIDKAVEAGDTVSPGQVLATLYDPAHMQLVASVRESLAHRMQVGDSIGVEVQALQKTCSGEVSEIVPEAESASRSFQVKVTGPCPTGIYSGMFGRLLIPLDDEEVLLVPSTAVRRIGQLDIVQVAERTDRGMILFRRAVTLGRTFGEDVEVLSGLKAGERVALNGKGAAANPGT